MASCALWASRRFRVGCADGSSVGAGADFRIGFLDCSHGFRPGRSAADALSQIEEGLKQGRCEVYDADLSGYFDTIPHDKLSRLCAHAT